MAGWGQVFGKIAEWFPGKTEARRNEIERLEKEQDELQKKPVDYHSIKRMEFIAQRLSVLYKAAKNAA